MYVHLRPRPTSIETERSLGGDLSSRNRTFATLEAPISRTVPWQTARTSMDSRGQALGALPEMGETAVDLRTEVAGPLEVQ